MWHKVIALLECPSSFDVCDIMASQIEDDIFVALYNFTSGGNNQLSITKGRGAILRLLRLILRNDLKPLYFMLFILQDVFLKYPS